MKIICSAIMGSHGYGLATPNSDIDERGVFVHTDPSFILGLNKKEHESTQADGKDVFYWELRHAINLLRRGNTQLCELLWNQQWASICPEWELVVKNRDNLLSPHVLFRSVRGYFHNEIRLANGSRLGEPGGKRNEAIKKYGFSPNNFIQAFRLCYCVGIYFQKGYFPVNLATEDRDFYEGLMRLKTEPEKAVLEELNKAAEISDKSLIWVYENRTVKSVFNPDIANKICFDIYGDIIKNLKDL